MAERSFNIGKLVSDVGKTSMNSGSEDIVVYSVLSPLPIEMEPAPDFEYPE